MYLDSTLFGIDRRLLNFAPAGNLKSIFLFKLPKSFQVQNPLETKTTHLLAPPGLGLLLPHPRRRSTVSLFHPLPGRPPRPVGARGRGAPRRRRPRGRPGRGSSRRAPPGGGVSVGEARRTGAPGSGGRLRGSRGSRHHHGVEGPRGSAEQTLKYARGRGLSLVALLS